MTSDPTLPVEAQAVPDLPVATITKDEALSALADVYLALPFGSASRVTLVRRFIEQSRPTAAADLHQQIINLPCNAPDLRTRADVRQAYAEGHRDARHAAAELVAASPAAAADLDLFNEACAILSAVMSYELPTELKHRIVNVLCTDASPVAPVGAPALSDEQIAATWNALPAKDLIGGKPPEEWPRILRLAFARALLSRQGCELATDATKQLREPSVHPAATPIDQDFRMRPASSEAAPSAEPRAWTPEELAFAAKNFPDALPRNINGETE